MKKLVAARVPHYSEIMKTEFYIFRVHRAVQAFIWFLCLTIPAVAQTGVSNEVVESGSGIEQAVLKTKEDIKDAVEALAETRKRVSEERSVLSAELKEISAAVEINRRKLRRLENILPSRDAEQALLKNEINGMLADISFVRTAVSEYRRAVTTRALMPELQFISDDIEKFDKALAGADEDVLPDAFGLLTKTAEAWNMMRVGGYYFEGKCLDSTGMESIGRFMIFGPVAYFSSDSELGGLAVTRRGSILPGLYDNISENSKKQIALLARGGEAEVPVDMTGGDAIKADTTRKTITEHIRDGGAVMIPILLIGVSALGLVLLKVLWLMRTRTENAGAMLKVRELMAENRMPEALQFAESLKSPLGRMLAAGLKHHHASREQREEIMSETLLACMPEMERHLGTLAVFGAVAPLLGLLGTVTGMIHTFRLVTVFGTGDARQLSGGISEALVTTVAGLIVAIPVLLAHAFLSRSVKNMISELETTVTGIFEVQP